MQQALQHWESKRDPDGIEWVRCRDGGALNGLSQPALRELTELAEHLSTDKKVRGAVFHCGSEDGFPIGTNSALLRELAQASDPLPRVRALQALFGRIENLRIPTAAVIDGACIGDALELALACHYRIATDAYATRLSLPHVELGVSPLFGSCLRLGELLGGHRALPLLLRAETFPAARAQELGLVDALVPRRHLAAAARAAVIKPAAARQQDWLGRLTNLPLLRSLVAERQRRKITADSGHHPAPGALIDLWERQTGGRETGLLAEAETFVSLVRSEAAANLQRVAELRHRLQTAGALASNPIRHVHITGAGALGGAFAGWCALKGLRVTLHDEAPRRIGATVRHATQLFRSRLADERAVTAALDRLQPDPAGDGVDSADLVIEAVSEDVAAKQELLRSLEPRLKPAAIFASNTASVPLATLAEALQRPERLVGLHFFGQVARVPLIELVATGATAADTLAAARGFIAALDRLPLPVTDSPGYLINRVLGAYMSEAMTLYEEGVAATVIDRVTVSFGMREGPLEMADRIGLGICLRVMEYTAPVRGTEVPAVLREQVEAGRLGRKTGAGFYDYKYGRPIRHAADPDHSSLDEIGDRILYRLLNAAVAALREGVVADGDMLDAGMIFAGGFPDFRGGPIHYCRERGSETCEHRLRELAGHYGERFTPDLGWQLLRLPSQQVEGKV